MEFFKNNELTLLDAWAGIAYDKENPVHKETGEVLRDGVWSKTIYWAKQIVEKLGDDKWEFDGTRMWTQRGWGEIRNVRKQYAIIKGYTWARIYKKGDKNKDIFFTVGYGADKYFLIKLDFQRQRGSDLTDLQKDVCNDFITRNQPLFLKISADELDSYNWERLVFESANFINSKEEFYEEAIALTWQREDHRSSFTYSLKQAQEIVNQNLLKQDKLLDLGNCGLTNLMDIPDLFKCTHLEYLILSNEWGENNGKKWIRRASKNIGKPNNLQKIPSAIKSLKNLQVLICGGDWRNNKSSSWNRWNIKDMTPIGKLLKLTYINLSNNSIEDSNCLMTLKNLQILYLNNNQFSSFISLHNFKNLREVNLSNNQLKSVRFLRKAKNLEYIDLHSNVIQDLNPIKELIDNLDIEDTKWKHGTINIADNPIVNPPIEVVRQGKGGIVAYLNLQLAEQKIDLPIFKNNEVKLILVGNSNAGKSTLSYWLRNKEIKTDIPSTHWMEIEKWDVTHNAKQYKIRIFDFGGQEYYHDTHHLFFTNNTVYVVLWDKESNRLGEIPINIRQPNKEAKEVFIQMYPLNYWLDSIKYYTKKKKKSSSEKEIEQLLSESEKSKTNVVVIDEVTIENIEDKKEKDENNILVVQNKVDTNADVSFLNQGVLKSSYSNIYDFLLISVIEQRRLTFLENLIFDVIDNMPLIGREFLGTWAEIKRVIEDRTFESEMTIVQFKGFCNDIIVNWSEVKGKSVTQINRLLFDDKQTETFAQYLNDIGILLFYPENKSLSTKVFLNQSKILDSIYKILLNLEETKGEFDTTKIFTSLGKIMFDEECENVINLMLLFKIIFVHPSKDNTYLAPLYLPKKPAKSINLFFNAFKIPFIRFEYTGFIHKNVILEFFQLYGRKALKEPIVEDLYYYWREGIIIKDEDSGEIILVQFFIGNSQESNAYIDIYCLNKNKNDDFVNSVIENLDRINEGWEVAKSITYNGIDFVPLQFILENEVNKNWIFSFKNKPFKLTDFKKYLKGILPMKKIFISYSKADVAHLQKLENHLSLLKRNGAIATWNCRKLLPGDKWDGKIKKELEEADIIIFLVSDDFLATDYIWDIEIKRAIEREEKENIKVIPIIVRACDWEESPLGIFNTAPRKAEVISSSDDIDEAWKKVVLELKQVITSN